MPGSCWGVGWLCWEAFSLSPVLSPVLPFGFVLFGFPLPLLKASAQEEGGGCRPLARTPRCSPVNCEGHAACAPTSTPATPLSSRAGGPAGSAPRTLPAPQCCQGQTGSPGEHSPPEHPWIWGMELHCPGQSPLGGGWMGTMHLIDPQSPSLPAPSLGGLTIRISSRLRSSCSQSTCQGQTWRRTLHPASSTKAGEVLAKAHISRRGVPTCLPTQGT